MPACGFLPHSNKKKVMKRLKKRMKQARIDTKSSFFKSKRVAEMLAYLHMPVSFDPKIDLFFYNLYSRQFCD